MTTKGKPYKDEKDKKVKYGISIDRHLFDKMKNEEISVSKFIQNLVKKHYEKENIYGSWIQYGIIRNWKKRISS